MTPGSKRLSPPRTTWLDFGSSLLAHGSALLVTAVAVWLLWETLRLGLGEISWSFLTTEPDDAGRAGGIGPILVSTLLIVSTCLAASLPIGIGAAIWLTEFSRSSARTGRAVRRSLDVLAGVPSIVFGLFGNAFFCVTLGFGYSILSGGLTLACMVLPIFIRIAESGIRAVPNDYRFAAASLGLSRTTTLFRIVLPAALPALAAGLVLALGRALAETAALLFTSGYVTRMPNSLFDSGRSLSVHIYDMAMNVAGGDARAYATAATLVLILLVINGTTVLLTAYAVRSTTQQNSLSEGWRG